MNIEKLKKSKKGFTLVEIIVVLVIIAILAAIAIPAMTGWIDKANEKAIAAEARTALLAAQTVASEDYGLGGTDAGDYTDATKTDLGDLADDIPGTVTFSAIDGVVTSLSYANGDKDASYDGTDWTY
jgi:type IV pilus assembly protein PilA